MRLRKGLVVLLVLLTMSLTVTQAFATNIKDLRSRQQEIRNKMKTTKEELDSKKKEANKIKKQIDELNEQINQAKDELEGVIDQLEELNGEIDVIVEELEEAEEKLGAKSDEFGRRLRTMYKNGHVGYLELLLASEDLSDLLSRNHMVQKIADQDKELISYIKEQRDFIEEKRIELETQKAAVDVVRLEIESRKSELEEATKEKETLMASLKGDINTYEREYGQLNNSIADLERRIARLQNPTVYTVSSSRGGTSSRGTSVATGSGAAHVISTARRYLGSRYVHGGAGPGGFDCSGYTQYVYRQAGISLPRTTTGQANMGSRVDRNNLKPGDLLIFSNTYRRGISHVGIYLGNGLFIHAANARVGVEINTINSGYWRNHFSFGRRVL